MQIARIRIIWYFVVVALPIVYFCQTFSISEVSQYDEPCHTPPPGMVCIPGGKGVVGRFTDNPEELKTGSRTVDETWDNEKSHAIMGSDAGEYPIEISTFYLDKNEVTNEEYEKCVNAGVCTRFAHYDNPLYNGFRGPKQPAVPISWEQAFTYCKWVGKRLPTEAEWEYAARGGSKATIYPWGNHPPSCEKANYRGCRKHGIDKTVDVGSFPAGHFGIYDMAGNGYEWVHDWASECREGCRKPCGPPCYGRDPKGPCAGKYPCPGHNYKVLRGGSFWWPAEYMKGWARRLEKVHSGGNRLSFRCASSTPYLNNPPGWMIVQPPEDPGPIFPLTEEEKQIMSSIEFDVLDKPLCDHAAWARVDCKDPLSYVTSNESQHYLFMPYVKNLGGAYVGVAAEANYSFIAYAKSRFAFLLDYDIHVVRLHRIVKALVKVAETPKDFIALFEERNASKAEKIIREAYKGDEKVNRILWVYRYYRNKLYAHYRRISQPSPIYKDFGWLRNQESYAYIRTMYDQGRIAIVEGDLLKDKALRSIGKAVLKLGTVVRIYYPSNAEEMWSSFPTAYRINVLSLPFDERSIALRTIWAHTYPKGRKQRFWHPPTSGIYWHYVVHGALDYQKKLQYPDYDEIDAWKEERLPTHSKFLSIINLPGTLPQLDKKLMERI
ncbi:MAG: SUMF1/EgtB/PvdO family nonheme iron enzyme [Spirochaetes bacterium]|nr:SUMF1/EgtB/PvdO family nonheme iron enzyme [Spirochaetota bacterium]